MHIAYTVAVAALTAAPALARERLSFDMAWRFQLGDIPGYQPACNATFPISLNNTQCYGLSQAGAVDATSCAATCCENQACLLWQWCPLGDTSCGAPGECWIGNDCSQNASVNGWISAARVTAPPLPPPPPYQTSGPTTLDYTDSDWRLLNVPHDFVVEGEFSPDADRGHGYLPFNISWYRKHFTVDAAWEGSIIYIDFDGVYRNSDVWLNGAWLGHRNSGYVSFRYYLHNATDDNGNPVLNYGGGDNVIVVRADALTAQEGWFYEGGGVYRHVWLNSMSNTSIVPWGVYVPSYVQGTTYSPNGADGPQTADSALLMISTDVANANPANATVTLVSTVMDASGAVVGVTSSPLTLIPGGWQRVSQQITVNNVSLWNPAAPYLYSMTSQIMQMGVAIDVVNTTFGVRDMIFDANQGLIINGFPTKIKGMCNHQDFAGVGTAVPDRIQEWRVTSLLAVGVNGWRTAHNPVNPELLDYTDKHGMLVWAENRFINDGVQPLAPQQLTSSANVPPVVDPQLLTDCQDMVLRDRNHPSIYVWSLCNEGGCQIGNPQGDVYSSAFKQVIYEADSSRPVTANTEWSPTDTFTNELDVMAFSYNYGAYDSYHEMFPFKPLMGGEAASCVSDRGFYGPSNTTTGYVNANDFGCAQGAWLPAAQKAWVAGNNAWTGLDYRGEPTPDNWPAVNSHFGILDLSGFWKDSAYWYAAWWLKDNTGMIHTVPSHWTDPIPAGTSMNMYVFAAASSAELIVNGVSQGNVSIEYLGFAQWNNVVYQPGNLSARSYDANGALLASTVIPTAVGMASLSMWIDVGSEGLYADAHDTALVGVSVLDSAGVLVGNAAVNVTFTLSGVDAAVSGVGNGDPSDHSPNKANWRLTFNGYARALITAGTVTGSVTVTASAPGLQPASVQLNIVPPPSSHRVAV